MTFRDKLALNGSPLLIRLALAAVFMWAGASKLFYSDTVTGDDAAALANLGVIAPPNAPAPVAGQSTPASTTTPTPATETAPATTPTPTPTDSPDATGAVTFTLPGSPAQTGSALRLYTGAEFPNSIPVSRRHTSITLTLYKAAQPDAQGRHLWPGALASPVVLRTLAWTGALSEFAGGFLVLVGFLARLSALSLVGTMLVAMLLTTIGPATLSGDAFLGFLPQPRLAESAAWGAAWTPMLFQFTLLMAAGALVLSGPGALSLDRLVFGGRGSSADGDSGDDEDGDEDD